MYTNLCVSLWMAVLFHHVACETYSEHLLVHSLTPTASSVTTAASFTGTVSLHGQTFPRPIAALFDTYPVQSFRLALTRGRWHTEWCAALQSALLLCGVKFMCCHFRAVPSCVSSRVYVASAN